MSQPEHYLKRELYELVRHDPEIFEFLQAGTLDGIWYWDVEKPTEEWLSPQFKALFGYTDDEIPNTSAWWQRNIHPEDLALALENFGLHMRDASHPYDQIVRYRHKDGSTVWVRCRGMAIRDETGKPVRMLGAHTDVTALKRAETELKDVVEALRRSENRFRRFAEILSKVIWLFDQRTGRFLFIGPAWGRVFGDSEERVVENPEILFDRVHEEDRPRLRAQFSAPGGPSSWDVEHRVVLPSGEIRWYRCHASRDVAPSADQHVLAGFFEDFTDRRRWQEERDLMEERLRQTQKLESLGVLAGGIAHDFNNLIMGMLGNADLALHALSDTQPGRENLEAIVVSAKRSADLCNQLLAYSGKGRFVVKNFDLSQLVSEMSHLLEVTISKKAILKLHLAHGLPAIHADPTQMRQVVMNLITNASEAIGERSGIISLATGVMDCDQPYLRSANLAWELGPGRYVWLEASDTGCGMDKATQARMFEPFFTTKFTGRGLGLSAVLGIVHAMKGGLKVYSEPGRGTTFKLLFPASDSPVEQTPSQRGHANWRSEGTILLVDDDDSVRTVARLMLESLGFKVIPARDGREGVELFAGHFQEIRAVVVDMMMPHLTGEEAFGQFRAIKPDAIVLLTSGYTEDEALSRFAGKGLSGFLQKPYTREELVRALQKVLGYAQPEREKTP